MIQYLVLATDGGWSVHKGVDRLAPIFSDRAAALAFAVRVPQQLWVRLGELAEVVLLDGARERVIAKFGPPGKGTHGQCRWSADVS